MADNNLNSTTTSLFDGLSNIMSTKTVIGDVVNIGDTIILPLVDVSFGMGVGANSGGMGGKMTPSAVLIVNNGTSKLVNIKSQDSVSKILDMIPDLVNKFTKKDKTEKVSEEEIIEIAKTSVENK
jgi:uncharacterized spore protein YtfJ